MTAIEILEATRARLVEKGWARGGKGCLYMTLDAVVESPVVWNTIGPRALNALRTVIGSDSIVSWNDRQVSDLPVFVAIDAAIELLKQDEHETY